MRGIWWADRESGKTGRRFWDRSGSGVREIDCCRLLLGATSKCRAESSGRRVIGSKAWKVVLFSAQ
jgi:hypothetical protein